MNFHEGQLVIYKSFNKLMIGKIKDNFIWYHAGDTAALTDFELLKPIINEYEKEINK